MGDACKIPKHLSDEETSKGLSGADGDVVMESLGEVDLDQQGYSPEDDEENAIAEGYK